MVGEWGFRGSTVQGEVVYVPFTFWGHYVAAAKFTVDLIQTKTDSVVGEVFDTHALNIDGGWQARNPCKLRPRITPPALALSLAI